MKPSSAQIKLRSGRGLGDSVYLQSIARYFASVGRVPEVCTIYPDVFRPLKDKIIISTFRRDRIDISAHYIGRKKFPDTDQFVDCCIAAGIPADTELKLDWVPTGQNLIRQVKAAGKPVIVVQLPRAPMGRADGYGDDLLPDFRTVQRAINIIGDRAFIVQIGKGKPLFRFHGLNLDLANKTSVAQMIDVVSACDGALGYCSFIAPLAESLNKPLLLIWSRQGANSKTEFIRLITPRKIFHRASSRAVFDDCSELELFEAVNALCD